MKMTHRKLLEIRDLRIFRPKTSSKIARPKEVEGSIEEIGPLIMRSALESSRVSSQGLRGGSRSYTSLISLQTKITWGQEDLKRLIS